jgi:hypothetical protein
MDLIGDDPAILTNQEVIINGVRYEAALTKRYLILVDSENASVHEDILLTDIRHAHAADNIINEPVIRLTVNTPSGETRSVELIFARVYAGQNIRHRDQWIATLKKTGIETSEEPNTTRTTRRGENATGLIDAPAAPRRSGDWMPSIIPRKVLELPPEKEPIKRTPAQNIALMALIVIMIIGGVSVYGQFLVATMPPTQDQRVTPAEAVPAFTLPPTLPTTPTPTVGATETPQIPATPGIPGTGVWVFVQYAGNYTGEIGSQGNFLQVNMSGDQFFMIPVNSGLVEGSIDKQDGNAANMTVGVYQNGVLVSTSSTTIPYGEINIRTQLAGNEATGTGLIQSPVVQVVPTLEASLPPEEIPQTGTWFRIQYPGNYTGTVGSGGFVQDINSTGNRFFQVYGVPASGGIIDGSIDKQDGSAADLIVEIYQDGTLLARTNTTTPYGVVDLHVPL